MIDMDLPLTFALIIFGLSTVNSRPKDSGILPKDYYDRQILQPLPGYIPVYIQTEGVDEVKNRGSFGTNEQSLKISNLNAKSKSNYNDGKISSRTESKNLPGKNLERESNAKKIDLFRIKENHERNTSNKFTELM